MLGPRPKSEPLEITIDWQPKPFDFSTVTNKANHKLTTIYWDTFWTLDAMSPEVTALAIPTKSSLVKPAVSKAPPIWPAVRRFAKRLANNLPDGEILCRYTFVLALICAGLYGLICFFITVLPSFFGIIPTILAIIGLGPVLVGIASATLSGVMLIWFLSVNLARELA